MRLTLLATAVLLALAGALPAHADDAPAQPVVEVFQLENGYAVRGRAIKETEDKIVVRLSGTFEHNTITLRRDEIKDRRVHADPNLRRIEHIADTDAEAPIQSTGTLAMPRTTRYDRDGNEHVAPVPGDEPELEREGFGERLVRVTKMAFPDSLEGRLLVGFLALLALSILVGAGARMLGMKSPSLHASTTLGFLLGAFLLADILLHDEMLRADRALWVLPLQVGVWLAIARGLLDAPLSRIVPLFSMVLFASLCLMFLTGSLLVSM